MAGDWIKVEHVTPDKPEVHGIAEALSLDPDAVFGKLCRVWIWADQQIRECNAARVTKTLVDRITGVTGFAQTMVDVGWLVTNNGHVEIPHFDHHNSQTAKSRALTYNRVKRTRNAPRVTKALPETETEKRKKPSISPFQKPTLEEVKAYCQEQHHDIDPQTFIDFYESNGWKVGKNAMKSWRGAVGTWVARRRQENGEHKQRISTPEEERDYRP